MHLNFYSIDYVQPDFSEAWSIIDRAYYDHNSLINSINRITEKLCRELVRHRKETPYPNEKFASSTFKSGTFVFEYEGIGFDVVWSNHIFAEDKNNKSETIISANIDFPSKAIVIEIISRYRQFNPKALEEPIKREIRNLFDIVSGYDYSIDEDDYKWALKLQKEESLNKEIKESILSIISFAYHLKVENTFSNLEKYCKLNDFMRFNFKEEINGTQFFTYFRKLINGYKIIESSEDEEINEILKTHYSLNYNRLIKVSKEIILEVSFKIDEIRSELSKGCLDGIGFDFFESPLKGLTVEEIVESLNRDKKEENTFLKTHFLL